MVKSVIQSLRYIPANVVLYNYYTEIVFLGPTAIAFTFREKHCFSLVIPWGNYTYCYHCRNQARCMKYVKNKSQN